MGCAGCGTRRKNQLQHKHLFAGDFLNLRLGLQAKSLLIKAAGVGDTLYRDAYVV